MVGTSMLHSICGKGDIFETEMEAMDCAKNNVLFKVFAGVIVGIIILIIGMMFPGWFKLWAYTIVLAIVMIALVIYNTTDKRGIAQLLFLFIGVGITAIVSWGLLGIAITSGSYAGCGGLCAVVGAGAYLYMTRSTVGNKAFMDATKNMYHGDPAEEEPALVI